MSSSVRMFVLAGGKGDRFFPISTVIPKCLVPVAASIRWYNVTRSSASIAIGDGIVQDMSAPFTFEIEARYDFYYAPATYARVLSGSGYIFVDSSFAIYGQTPQWKVVMKRVDLQNVAEVVGTVKDFSRIYDDGLISIIFKER